MLDGARNAYRDIAMLNAAGALVVAGKARELAEGVAMAGDALDLGRGQGAFSTGLLASPMRDRVSA